MPGAAVCVSPDRYLAGTLAETALGCTVHVLDDGFQHLELARDLDVLVTTLGEIPAGRVLPMGRLREPVDAAARAHVLVVSDANAAAAASEAWALGISQACGAVRELRRPILVGSARLDGSRSSTGAGFLTGSRLGARRRRHRASPALRRLVARGGVAGGGARERFRIIIASRPRTWRALRPRPRRPLRGAVLTTDKDAVRFDRLGPLPFALFRVPLAVRFEPEDVLFGSIREMLRRRAAGEDGA